MRADSFKFSWDEEKNRINRRKHGISFETAIHIFADRERIEIYDEAHSIEEDRYQTIGMVQNVLFVVYTERADEIRIISARKANKTERRLYYGQTGNH